MRFRCPFCFYTVAADDSLRGYPIQCPGCSRELTVPASRFQDGCVIGDFLIRTGRFREARRWYKLAFSSALAAGEGQFASFVADRLIRLDALEKKR